MMLKMPSKYKYIPGWFKSPYLYKLVAEKSNEGSHFVEVGSYLGQSSIYMAELIQASGKNIKLDCIDVWQIVATDEYLGYGMSDEQKLNQIKAMQLVGVDARKLFSYFVEEAQVSNYIEKFQGPSFNFVDRYKDESLDFVYIDISNDYESIVREIKNWLPKIKSGGILGGDDYGSETVSQAVNDLLSDVKLSDKGLDARKPEKYCTWYIQK